MIKKFMGNIAEEKDGFKFGKVFRFDEESVVAILPILRENPAERDYIVLSEAENINIKDSGRINSITITNNETKPIFIRSGSILKGQTQERAVISDYVVYPNKTEIVPVVCVHQSRPITTSAKMKYHSLTPTPINLTSQSDAWGSTRVYCCSMMDNRNAGSEISSFTSDVSGHIPTDDLVSYVEDYSKKIEKILPKIKYEKNQVGIVLFDVEGVYVVELFDLTLSWRAIRDDIVKREGEKIVEKDLQGIFQLKPERANELAIAVLSQNYKQTELYNIKNESAVYSLESDGYKGQVAVLNDKVIHLNLIRKEK